MEKYIFVFVSTFHWHHGTGVENFNRKNIFRNNRHLYHICIWTFCYMNKLLNNRETFKIFFMKITFC